MKFKVLGPLFLLTSLVCCSCNGASFYRYNQKKVKPAMAQVYDLNLAYSNDWELKIYERKNDANNTSTSLKEIESISIDEDPNYSDYRLIVYSNNYFAFSKKETISESLDMVIYHVKQFYGPNYSFNVVGNIDNSYVPNEKDINIDILRLTDSDTSGVDFNISISEYDVKKDKVIDIGTYNGMENSHTSNYAQFFFRRVMQDKYFAINYKDGWYDTELWYGAGVNVTTDNKKTIIEYLGDSFSYKLNYLTIHEKFVL